MPRRAKGPRLWLRQRAGREPTWVILDRGKEHRTRCGEGDLARAERKLAEYIAAKYEPPKRSSKLAEIVIADIMTIYLREHAPHVANTDFLIHTAKPILDWWGTKTLADIRGQSCRDYVTWRCLKGVSDQTARHDLKTLRAAINYYHREYGPLDAVPAITMPAKGQPKDRWLTRSEAAKLIRLCRRFAGTMADDDIRRWMNSRLARFILIGIYTGTRKDSILKLKWTPSLTSGWIDLERGLLYRMGAQEASTNKRRPPCPIPPKLLAHLRRWKAIDAQYGWNDVCHYRGQTSDSLKRSWTNACERAGLGWYVEEEKEGEKMQVFKTDVTPHVTRHTCCTWLMHRGVPIAEAAGFVGMSVEMFDRVYGHHHPDYMKKASGRG